MLEVIQKDSNIPLNKLKVDRGAVGNDFLIQFQSDILRILVIRPSITETTALGVAYLAGMAVNFWKNKEEIALKWKIDKEFFPNIDKKTKENLYKGWKKAVSRSLKLRREMVRKCNATY